MMTKPRTRVGRPANDVSADAGPFAHALRAARDSKEMTRRQLAEACGVTEASISNWESGSDPGLAMALRLSRLLGFSLDALADK